VFRKPEFFPKILIDLALHEPPRTMYEISKSLEAKYPQVHRDMHHLRQIGYVKIRETPSAERRKKVNYELTELGLVRALVELKTSEDNISMVSRYYPNYIFPVLKSWNDFKEADLAKSYLGIMDLVFHGMREEFLGPTGSIERGIWQKGSKADPSELADMPLLVRDIFLISLGLMPKASSIVAQDDELFRLFLTAYENIRFDQMLYAFGIQKGEFQVIEQRQSLGHTVPPTHPRMPRELVEKIRKIQRKESKRKYTRRLYYRLVLGILDEYVFRV
jgi:hypothetical protein